MDKERRAATAQYIAKVTQELQAMAHKEEMDLLAYLLAMARDNAEETAHHIAKGTDRPGR